MPVGDATLDELRDALVDASCALLVESLAEGLGEAEPQHGEPLYARKIKPEEHRLDFALSAAELARVIRLGRAWTTLDGKRLRINTASVSTDPVGDAQAGAIHDDRIATSDGWLVLDTVQPEGKKAVAATDWLRGARHEPGTVLGAGLGQDPE